MKTLYIECNMGAAGDMLMAALSELLPDPEGFVARMNALGLPGVRFQRRRTEKCGITGTHMAVTVDGADVSSFRKRELTRYRRTDVGFVFQFYNLIPNLTALENVEIAAKLSKNALDAGTVLAQVGLADRAGNFPAQLSGGEQQRVAIARALAKNPKLLLCDEPTGALDYRTGKAILKLLQDTCRQSGMTVIIITHNKALCAMADRVVRVRSGTVESVTVNETVTPVEQIEW